MPCLLQPFLVEDVDHNSLNTINTKALVNICKRYQEHAHSCAETVANEQNQLTSRMKEVIMLYIGYSIQDSSVRHRPV